MSRSSVLLYSFYQHLLSLYDVLETLLGTGVTGVTRSNKIPCPLCACIPVGETREAPSSVYKSTGVEHVRQMLGIQRNSMWPRGRVHGVEGKLSACL